MLLNTGFSAPQLADVLEREGAQVLVYDEEFADLLGPARERLPGLVEVVAWSEDAEHETTVDGLIDAHLGVCAATPDPARTHRAADLGHDGYAEGRSPRGWRRRPAGGDARPDPVAGR